MLNTRQQTEMRVMVVLGIVQQLLATRQSKLFSHLELTLSQFGVLNHFNHKPKQSLLVTELAEVMEMNQPGITKIVTVLLNKGLLDAETDKEDRRKRHLKITQKGLKTCGNIMTSLAPDISHCFASWNNDDLSQMHEHMEILMKWLDGHRDDIERG